MTIFDVSNSAKDLEVHEIFIGPIGQDNFKCNERGPDMQECDPWGSHVTKPRA